MENNRFDNHGAKLPDPYMIGEIVRSVESEQAALSQVLGEEREKLQKAVAVPSMSDDTLLQIHHSVQSMINAIARLEDTLQLKMGQIAAQRDERAEKKE